MADLATYSPEDVEILIAGFVAITGMSNNTFVRVQKNTPAYTSKESADGKISRVFRPSTSYTVTLTLASTSASNDVLTVLSKADQITQTAKFPLLIKDLSGSTLLFAQSCWIEDIPDTSLSTEVTERNWIFQCADATFHVGGNESASSLLEDLFYAAGGLAAGNQSFEGNNNG